MRMVPKSQVHSKTVTNDVIMERGLLQRIYAAGGRGRGGWQGRGGGAVAAWTRIDYASNMDLFTIILSSRSLLRWKWIWPCIRICHTCFPHSQMHTGQICKELSKGVTLENVKCEFLQKGRYYLVKVWENYLVFLNVNKSKQQNNGNTMLLLYTVSSKFRQNSR